ncbi:MAG: tetratricopeptide repeat protein [Holophaga sp.]
MNQPALPHDLPTTLAALRQERVDGELVLEQNDGVRRLYWRKGELVYLHSDAAGEQFGNYLLRQGIIDFAALNRLLATDERYRFGEKVVQWGLMTVDERDTHLRRLQEQVMINALEHPVIRMSWNGGSLNVKLSEDLHLKLDHRHFIWNTFMEAHNLQPSFDLLRRQEDWKWEGIPRLLEHLSDLPFNPAAAYSLSFLGSEPISFETFLNLSAMGEEEAGRTFLSLWAVGALILTQGTLPTLKMTAAAPSVPVLAPPVVPPVPPSPAILVSPPPSPASIPAATPSPKNQNVSRSPGGDAEKSQFVSRSPGGDAEKSQFVSRSPVGDTERPPTQDSRTSPSPAIELDRRDEPQPEFLEVEPEPERVPAPLPEPDTIALETQPMDQTPEERARSLHRKARQLHLKERIGEAIHCLELSVQLDPSSDEAYAVWLLLGQLRTTNPAWSTRAVNALQAASRIRPKAADPWIGMGQVYYRKGFRTNAVACFHKALELDPSVPIPPEVDYRELEAPLPPEPQQPTTLLSRFKSILKGSDR